MASAAPQIREDVRTAPAGELLAALARELECARVLGFRVEAAVCSLAVQGQIDPAVVRELQQLDMVLQQLAALRDFALELSRCADGSGMMPVSSALERVSLGELRARLGGATEAASDSADGWELL